MHHDVAALIRGYNPTMAVAYIAQPFRRVQIAVAVAAGIAAPKAGHDYEMGATLIAMAELEREERLAALELAAERQL